MRALLPFLLALSLAAPARADDDKAKQAAAHYKQGRAFFDQGAYDQAIAEYQKAYDLDQKAAHLFNIGRAHHLKGDRKAALDFYRRYLTAEPEGQVAAQARQFVVAATRELEEAEAQRKAAEQADKKKGATARVRQAEAYTAAGAHLRAGEEYQAAYGFDDDPEHLRQAAEAFARQPDHRKARAAYLAYLEKVPEGPQSDEVRKKVAETTRAIEREEEEARRLELAQPPPAASAPASSEPDARMPSYERGWIVLGAGLLVTGLAADLLAPNGDNGLLDASDVATVGLYGLGAATAATVILLPRRPEVVDLDKGLRVGVGIADMAEGIIQPGPFVGGVLTARLATSFALQGEVTFSIKRAGTEDCGQMDCVDTGGVTVYFIELPLLARVDLLPFARHKLHLHGGPVLALIAGGEIDRMGEIDGIGNLNDATWGLTGGLGFEVGAGPGRISFDARYANFFGAPLTGDEYATHQITAAVGYAFP